MNKFTPPTIDEVRAYIIEKNYNLDAEVFWYSYDKNDWKTGSGKYAKSMSRWRSAVSLWAVQGWGRTGKSAREFQVRNQAGIDYRQKPREDYGDMLRGKKSRALEDMLANPNKDGLRCGQVPIWLIKEVLKEKT